MKLAMLESVSMTKRQMRRMLMLEGLGYAGITTLLVGTLGSAITYGIFKLFQQQADYAVFTFPFIQMLIAAAAQYDRDRMKDHILQLYKIPAFRFTTNGSGEIEKIAQALDAYAQTK